PHRGGAQGIPSVLWQSSFLICNGHTVPFNLPITHGVRILTHLVVGIALYGVDPAIFYFLHDAYVVGDERIAAIPLEENDHSRFRGCGTWEPLAPVLKPFDAHATAGEFGENARVQVAALIGAPADKYGA